MQKLDSTTLLIFTETKKGSTTGRTFQQTAGNYINAVWANDCDSELPANLFSLPINEQLDLCISRNDESYASYTTYELSNE